MYKKIVTISAGLFLALQLSFGPVHAASDIDGHWAEDKMQYLIEENILLGFEAGVYLPEQSVSRVQMASFLVRALNLKDTSNSKTFKDVNNSDWYYNNVNIASSYGIISGYDDGTFGPTKNVTREEMAKMIVSALEIAGIDTSKGAPLTFKDANKISGWAKSDVSVAYAYNLMSGKNGHLFEPAAPAKRAEAATVIYNLLFVDPEAPSIPKPGATTIEKVTYKANYSDALTAQTNANPKVDGGGNFVASRALVNYYMNPNNFSQNTPEFYQYLKLNSSISNLSESKVNNELLVGKGVLENKASSFIKAGQQYKINELYLISHALHETANGKSVLASGIEVGLDENKKPTMVTAENRSKLTNIKMTYNMYGIGASDSNPNKLGAERAYENGWFTVEDAIIGGAKFVRERYIDAGKDTLYKMRWNPALPATMQYATHVEWATIAGRNMQKMYVQTDAINTSVRYFEIPVYPGQPAASAIPKHEDRYAVNTEKAGKIGIIQVENMNLNVRSYPSTSASKMGELPNGSKVEIIGTNGGWYKIKFNNSEAWVSGDYVILEEEILPKPTALYVKPLDATLESPAEVAEEQMIMQEEMLSEQELINNTSTPDEVSP